MNEEEARKDASKHFPNTMEQWLKGCKDANAGIKHKSLNASYDAGYNFGIWSQEMKEGK